jgi:hypothetical protein
VRQLCQPRIWLTIVIMVLLGFFGANNPVYAQSTCTQCRDQLKAFQKNYAGKTCQTEYNICMKGCKK